MVKAAGTTNWSKAETDHLLTVLEAVLPLSPADWEEVKIRHDERFTSLQRPVSALMRKFTVLHRRKEPTGNPDIPSPVLKAKRIRNLIDEKTEGTRGSADSVLDEIRNDDQDEDASEKNLQEVENNLPITPLTPHAVRELARLGSHADKPFFEPIVQVIHLHKKPTAELYDVHISDGISYMAGTCAEAVSLLVDEEYFSLYSYIKVQEFAISTLANGNKTCELLQVENPMLANPEKKIGNPVDIFQPVVPRLPAYPLRSPIPTTVEFGHSLCAMRIGSSKKNSSGGGGSGNDDFTNIMQMMLMQQQSDREQRMADREHRNFLAEQDKNEREERARQQQLEREERAIQAREDRIQQQQDRMQQQQFMNMMMMQMMGAAMKRAREESDSDMQMMGAAMKRAREESDSDMQMMGAARKRAPEESDSDDEEKTNESTPRRSPRKK